MTFKTPDGKEFGTRAEWRDYMMLTFYSFKNKKNETEPLVKLPSSIDGQMFDIADCENSTLVVMDRTEQVQMDQLKNCRVFVGACESSMFIRNCDNCTFYTCCRQLRLREVTNCTFYIYSMAEVHIEYSNALKFAPFNGGYPEQAQHFTQAKLPVDHNLWYDIFDHNDPGKTRANWSLLPVGEYEAPWFPAGPCEPAVPITVAGTVHREDLAEGQAGSGGQAFGLDQLRADAAAAAAGSSAPLPGSPQKAPSMPPAAPASPAATLSSSSSSSAVPVAMPAPESPWRGDGVPRHGSASVPAAAESAEMAKLKTIFSVMSVEEQRAALVALQAMLKT